MQKRSKAQDLWWKEDNSKDSPTSSWRQTVILGSFGKWSWELNLETLRAFEVFHKQYYYWCSTHLSDIDVGYNHSDGDESGRKNFFTVALAMKFLRLLSLSFSPDLVSCWSLDRVKMGDADKFNYRAEQSVVFLAHLPRVLALFNDLALTDPPRKFVVRKEDTATSDFLPSLRREENDDSTPPFSQKLTLKGSTLYADSKCFGSPLAELVQLTARTMISTHQTDLLYVFQQYFTPFIDRALPLRTSHCTTYFSPSYPPHHQDVIIDGLNKYLEGVPEIELLEADATRRPLMAILDHIQENIQGKQHAGASQGWVYVFVQRLDAEHKGKFTSSDAATMAEINQFFTKTMMWYNQWGGKMSAAPGAMAPPPLWFYSDANKGDRITLNGDTDFGETVLAEWKARCDKLTAMRKSLGLN